MIMGEGWLLNDAWIQKGEGGVNNLGKRDYVISESSLTILFVNF